MAKNKKNKEISCPTAEATPLELKINPLSLLRIGSRVKEISGNVMEICYTTGMVWVGGYNEKEPYGKVIMLEPLNKIPLISIVNKNIGRA